MPVFNKMVYNGTEYILGGGGNIGEPLNLTVTTSGLDATITWEDNEIGTIPPTTFQKSELVRKIGSAPTSPSDGDLVVTETVKDTYKVSGYVDQGLTDGETYYYRVFSYSDLGGISYCDAVSVTISAGGWQPGVNTIAYRPLTSATTTTDMGGNNNLDLTNNGSVTFGLNAGVDCASINSSQRNALSNQDNIWQSLTGSQSFTYSLWIYIDSFSSGENGIMSINDGSYSEDRALAIMTNNTIRGYIGNSGGPVFVYTPTVNTGEWYLVNLVQDGVNNTMSVYLNGVLGQSASCTGSGEATNILGIGNKYPGNSSLHGYVSNVIIEDKVWSAQEISDYFNATKGDYGIS